MIITQTTRLILREITPDDAEEAYMLNRDNEVIKYTGDEAFESIEAARTFLQNYDHYRKYGFGRWAVIHKESKAFLGWCGLKYTPEQNEYDIGFRLYRKYWGQGYATEASIACIELGFKQFGFKEIVGRVMKQNIASIKVLKKSGLQYIAEKEENGEVWQLYAIKKKSTTS